MKNILLILLSLSLSFISGHARVYELPAILLNNDFCEDAIPINPGEVLSGSTIGETIDAVPECGPTNPPPAPGVWYSWTGTGECVNINVCNQTLIGYRPYITVYEGGCDNLICVEENRSYVSDFLPNCASARVYLPSVAGTEYHILIHSSHGRVGDFEIDLTPISHANDMVCNAIPLTIDLPATTELDLGCASIQPGEPSPGQGSHPDGYLFFQNGWGGDLEIQNTLWYTITAPASGNVRIGAFSAFGRGQMALWEAEDCGDFSTFSLIGANSESDLGGLFYPLINNSCLIPGNTYYLQIDGFNGYPFTGIIEYSDNNISVPRFSTTCPANQVISCDALVLPTPATTTDEFINLGGDIFTECLVGLEGITVSSIDEDNGGNCNAGNPRIATRLYLITDGVTTDTCAQIFTFEGNTQGPVITSILPSATINCGYDANPLESDITFTTDCGLGSTVNITGPMIMGSVNCPGTIYQFSYTVTDGCGQTSDPITRDFIIANATLTISCPADLSITYDETSAPSATGMATATDNCTMDGNDVVISFTDASTQEMTGCAQYDYTITRTWLAMDACSNSSSCTQIITVQDTTPPTIICLSNITLSCEDDSSPTALGMATATDNCSAISEITIAFSDVSSQGMTGCAQFNYTITRTWTATDACNNMSTCSQTITIEDTTAPSITCPADITVACDAVTTPNLTGMATATDNCATGMNDLSITFTDVNTQGMTGCSQFNYTITRTWMVTDACGNTNSCIQRISVEDSEGPLITCPANQMMICGMTPPEIALTATEFMAIDGTITDDCTSNLNDFAITATDDPINISFLDFCPGSSIENRTITRTYTITDVCGNSSTCTQAFIYSESTVDPVIISIPPDQTVDCALNAFAQLELFSAVGECSNITYQVSGPSTVGTAGCPGTTLQFTYTATDICGRFATHIQTYTLTNNGPEFICPPDICVIECPADTEMIQAQFDSYAELATVISSCSEASIRIGNNFNPNGFIQQNCLNPTVAVPGAVAYQVIRFTATDACGRNGTCTALVVLKDSDGPVMNGSVSVGLADCNDANLQQTYTDWATSQVNGLSAMDGCSDGAVSFSYAPLSPNTDCTSGLASTEVSFIAVDACGNETIITTFYRIIDYGTGEPVMATVSGNLMTEEDEMISSATVELDGFFNDQMETNSVGYYSFDLMMAENYVIEPSRNDHPLNGITTYDLILMGQHILEINLLDSPYKMIAADVNESGSITALDLIELRRLILHIDDEFSTGKTWTFVDAAFIFPNPTNPFATTYPTVYNINNLTTSQIIDFIGVKLGDLNASVRLNLLEAGDTRSSDGVLKVKLEDEMLSAGQTYQLAFKASDFKDVAGFQFTLDFEADKLEVLDYEGSELSKMSANNFGFSKAKEGKLTVSWNETQSITMADDATLFQVSFTAIKDVQLSEVLAISSSLTANEAYQGEARKEVILYYRQSVIDNKDFVLFQNQPNPFSQETVIGFQLPEASEATLTIYDISGRVVYMQTNTYEAGRHPVMINKADLGATGVLYYQLSTPEFNETKKMIVLK